MTTEEIITEVTKKVSDNFRTFGGGKDESKSNNPIAIALQDMPAQFAAGVDVKQVVEFIFFSIGELKQNVKNN